MFHVEHCAFLTGGVAPHGGYREVARKTAIADDLSAELVAPLAAVDVSVSVVRVPKRYRNGFGGGQSDHHCAVQARALARICLPG